MDTRPPIESFLIKSPYQKEDLSASAILEKLRGKDGKDGKDGLPGERGERGLWGIDGKDGQDGNDGVDGKNGKDGAIGKEGKAGKNGIDGKDGVDGSPDTPEEVVTKVNKSKTKIHKSQIIGFDEIENEARNANHKIQKYLNLGGGTSTGTTSPLTSKGDLYTYSTTNTRLPVGGDGQILSSDSTQTTGLKWINNSGGGGSTTFYDNEVASGSGTSFSVANTPDVGSVHVHALGQRLVLSNDYTISGTAITTINSWSAGDITVDYRVGGTNFVDNEVISGSGTSFTLANTPVTGSVHVHALGQRLKLTADYSISGTAITTINSWSAGDLTTDYRK